MATHTSLPIYKEAYALLSLAADLVKDMPRDFKGSFGRKIHEECIEILVLIARANAAKEKVPYIEALLERLQVTELLIRLGRDKQFISTKRYAAAVQVTTQIGKQAGGWKNYAAARPLRDGQGHHA
ncbi:four helix bundle protein [Duganella sp.]|uniref:four helix bundle protein n=1 Tax=Duganella sp. TaxID=1904440 RepID=UPI0031CF296D